MLIILFRLGVIPFGMLNPTRFGAGFSVYYEGCISNGDFLIYILFELIIGLLDILGDGLVNDYGDSIPFFTDLMLRLFKLLF